MKNPYGLRDGVLLSVDGVPRGIACECTCPACGHPLEAKKGSVNEHHFAHANGSDCGFGLETALHLLAKDVLSKKKLLLLPELKLFSSRKIVIVGTFAESKTLVASWTRIKFDAVYLEQGVENIIPDTILEVRGKRLLVEIKVTHGIDDRKLERIRLLNLPCIEFDFSGFTSVISRAHMETALCKLYASPGLGRGRWIYHPEVATTQAELDRVYTEMHLKPAPTIGTKEIQGSLFK